MFGEKNVDTKQKFSISSKKPDFNLFISPGIGVKMHITPDIGILVSINDDAYLVKPIIRYYKSKAKTKMNKQTIITILLLLTAVNGWAQKIWTNPSYRNEPQGFQFDVNEVEFRNNETVLHITVRNQSS